ncbi:hypothetical protein EV421DRAFT_1740584 [Armillaria borealis]|uniref:Uncharacterized protein n=1 Tax=Armillaria borealis TaxID=47425 RepID=A0AA39J2L8_9AGAR|nr:hypothetical protein EV421DRAFT_1740584 [Armillaria borealis]
MFVKTERAENDVNVQERPSEMLDELLEAHSIRGNGRDVEGGNRGQTAGSLNDNDGLGGRAKSMSDMTLLGKSGKCARRMRENGKRRVMRKTSDAGMLLRGPSHLRGITESYVENGGIHEDEGERGCGKGDRSEAEVDAQMGVSIVPAFERCEANILLLRVPVSSSLLCTILYHVTPSQLKFPIPHIVDIALSVIVAAIIGFVGCEPFRGEMGPNIESASEYYASGWYKVLYRTAISVEAWRLYEKGCRATLYFHRTEDGRDDDIDIDEASVSEELYDGSRSLTCRLRRSCTHSEHCKNVQEHAETYFSSVTKNQIYVMQNVSKGQYQYGAASKSESIIKVAPGWAVGFVHGSAHSGGARYPGFLSIWHHSSVTLSWCTADAPTGNTYESTIDGSKKTATEMYLGMFG